MTYKMMVGRDMRTYDGILLSEVQGFTGIFATYAMQRELGLGLFSYSWPSTFLIPFLIEPIATVYLPYKVMSMWIRTCPFMPMMDAENLLMPIPMDLSRYGDIMLNVLLTSLVFLFPGGFTHRIFLAMGLSHIWIYMFDSYKVLRSISACCFASMQVDQMACWMLSIPCGLILGSALFKANCMEGSPFCLNGVSVVILFIVATIAHILLHSVLLWFVVPKFRPQMESRADEYATCASQRPLSWFSANPMHCLRSQYIYRDDPSCVYCAIGKEHLLMKNEKLHLHFQDDQAEEEDYNSSVFTMLSERFSASPSEPASPTSPEDRRKIISWSSTSP